MRRNRMAATGLLVFGALGLLAASGFAQDSDTGFEERVIVTIPVPHDPRIVEEFHIMRSDFPPNVDTLQGVVMTSAAGMLTVRTTIDGYEVLRLNRVNEDPTRFREGQSIELTVKNRERVAAGATNVVDDPEMNVTYRQPAADRSWETQVGHEPQQPEERGYVSVEEGGYTTAEERDYAAAQDDALAQERDDASAQERDDAFGQESGYASDETRRTTLPQTASARQLVGLIGVLALVASIGLGVLARKLA